MLRVRLLAPSWLGTGAMSIFVADDYIVVLLTICSPCPSLVSSDDYRQVGMPKSASLTDGLEDSSKRNLEPSVPVGPRLPFPRVVRLKLMWNQQPRLCRARKTEVERSQYREGIVAPVARKNSRMVAGVQSLTGKAEGGEVAVGREVPQHALCRIFVPTVPSATAGNELIAVRRTVVVEM